MPFNATVLEQERHLTDVKHAIAHRGIQEDMRNIYHVKADQKAWNLNNKIIHEYRMSKYSKNK